MTNDHRVGYDKCPKVRNKWGLGCQDRSLANNTHNFQISSSSEEQRKGKRLPTSESVGTAVTVLERTMKFHDGRVQVTFSPVITAPDSA